MLNGDFENTVHIWRCIHCQKINETSTEYCIYCCVVQDSGSELFDEEKAAAYAEEEREALAVYVCPVCDAENLVGSPCGDCRYVSEEVSRATGYEEKNLFCFSLCRASIYILAAIVSGAVAYLLMRS